MSIPSDANPADNDFYFGFDDPAPAADPFVLVSLSTHLGGRSRPDVVVLIDAQVFSRLVATQLRRFGYDRPVLLYVAPAVWAWKSERAPKLKPLFDEVLSVLPFEPRVMAELGGPPTQREAERAGPASTRAAPAGACTRGVGRSVGGAGERPSDGGAGPRPYVAGDA